MTLNLVPKLSVRMAPLIPSGGGDPVSLSPLQPSDTLDLPELVQRLETSRLGSILESNAPWSVVSVEKPYTPSAQVMVLETSGKRWLPGPEKVSDQEGSRAMELVGAVLEFFQELDKNRSVHAGWNWSPYSWGEAEEESRGFQSIPTLWHTQVWGWPDLGAHPQVEWLKPDQLDRSDRRLFLENGYGRFFGRLIAQELASAFLPGSPFQDLFPSTGWISDARGFHARFEAPIRALFEAESFVQWIGPFSKVLEKIMKGLAEAMTTMNFEAAAEFLEDGQKRRTMLSRLREVPRMRPEEEIRAEFKRRGWPMPLFHSLFEPVRLRCTESGDRRDWWRKGFGYALAVGAEKGLMGGWLHLLPGVYLGPGGAAQACGVLLNRLKDKTLDRPALEEWSRTLWNLSRFLSGRVKGYREKGQPAER